MSPQGTRFQPSISIIHAPGLRAGQRPSVTSPWPPPTPPHPCPALAQGWTQGVREQGLDAEDHREPGRRAPGLRCALPSTLAAPTSLSLWSDGKEVPTALLQGPVSPGGRRGVQWEAALSPFQGNYCSRNLEPHVFLRLPNR